MIRDIIIDDSIFAYVGVPDNGKGPYPAIVLVHGGGGHAFPEWVEMWNDRGYAAIAMDTVGFMKEKGEWVHRTTPDNDNMKHPELPYDQQWMYHAQIAVEKSYDYIAAMDCVDSDRIGIMGISWGGVISSIAVSRRRYAFGIPVYGTGYLKYGKSEINVIFRDLVKNPEWFAENTFDRHSTPMLFMGWNDDNCFSTRPIGMSFAHAYRNCDRSRLCVKNLMMHSHQHGWNNEEPFVFADSIVKDSSPLAQIVLKDGIPFITSCPYEIESAKLYWLEEKEEYVDMDKFNYGRICNFRKETFRTKDCIIEGDRIVPCHDDSMSACYYEIIYRIGDKKLVSASEMIVQSWF